jgi:hypothetical protein
VDCPEEFFAAEEIKEHRASLTPILPINSAVVYRGSGGYPLQTVAFLCVLGGKKITRQDPTFGYASIIT